MIDKLYLKQENNYYFKSCLLHLNQKRINKIISVCKCHDLLCRKP